MANTMKGSSSFPSLFLSSGSNKGYENVRTTVDSSSLFSIEGNDEDDDS